MSHKRWSIKKADEATVAQISKDLPRVHPMVWRLLATRGISNYDAAKAFFRPALEDLHDPFLMKGMKAAVQRITEAVEWHERILIYGDYDVDGTTAVSVVYSFLKEQCPDADISFYIPHRYREGYGVSQQGIDYARENAITLLITLDCGIKNVSLIKQAQKEGIDVIVCDHHLPDNNLPPAYAILNPKQSDCPYPYKELSGCGIGFKLVQGLAQQWKLPLENIYKYLDLVATSIAADIVPIDGENRVLAFYGVKRVNEAPCQAIQAIKEVAGLQRAMQISDLVFVIGPRVNAAGRMDDARKAVELFVETDLKKCAELAEALQSDNFDRKEVDRNITEEALSLIQNDPAMAARKSTVVFQPHWHKGVVGIVASRLIDHYYRPTIVLTQSNEKVSGSARSVSGFNIYEALHECRDLLDSYGGHFFAAGMTMQPGRVTAFMEKFEEVVSRSIAPELLTPEIEIDAELKLSDITPAFYNIVRQFEPFGPANMRPLFVSRFCRDFRGWSKVVKDAHLKVTLSQPGCEPISGIGFGMADKYQLLMNGPVDVVYSLDENDWNGVKSIQMKLVDVRASV